MTHNGPQWSDIGEKDVNPALDYLFGVFNLDELDDICASNSSKIALAHLGRTWTARLRRSSSTERGRL